MQQRTIRKAVEVVGIGLHKGEPVKLRLEPMDRDSGIVFYREDIGMTIPLHPDSVIDTRMATTIGNEKGMISTIEHFLSAIYAYGIDNLRVVVDGNEMPIMDGSSISFCLLLDEAGIALQNAPKKVIRVLDEIVIGDKKDKYVSLSPSKKAEFSFAIDFDHPVIGRQHYGFTFSTHNYIEEIARARTFGFARDIQYLQSKNLALGANLQNAIGLDDHKVLNPEGLRFEDEFVRHKILDAMGDLMITGYNILGRYEAFAGSHALNYQLTSALLADPTKYEVVAVDALGTESFALSFA